MASTGAVAVMSIAAVVMVARRLVLVQMGLRLRLLLGIRRHTGRGFRAVEIRTETPVVGQACMEVKSVHVIVVVGCCSRGRCYSVGSLSCLACPAGALNSASRVRIHM
jgi:hypothetical protein